MPKTRVFADTNVIFEAIRTSSWSAISHHFAIETVDKCVEEALTGDPGDPRHVPVSLEELAAGLAARHVVTRKDLASLVLAHPSCGTLDDGERHLLAWLHSHETPGSPIIVLTTADKAALIATHVIGWLDNAGSLEYLARQAGVGSGNLNLLYGQYREDWLSRIKTKIRMGIIP